MRGYTSWVSVFGSVDGGACPCRPALSYASCCGPLHEGESASTAEQLMRSRYSAYAKGLGAYVARTWHPDTRPARIAQSVDADRTAWCGLEVVRTEAGGPGDDEGVVEFIASYNDGDGVASMRETSHFVRRRNKWVYVGPLEPGDGS